MRVQTLEVAPIDGKARAKLAPSLETLFAQHQGKVADKWSNYLHEYDRLLQDYRDRPIKFLEIGVQNGGSLEIWAQFFAAAEALVGCDIDPACEKLRYDDSRVSVVVGDANTDETQKKIMALVSELDIVVDDGSHRSSDVIRSFARYFPLLSDGGLFIIEDLHCSYWHEFEGGLFHPHSSMTFLKHLADVINHEHWGVPRFRAELLRGISEQYGLRFSEQELGRIHSIEFCNSMCVIRKAPTDDNALGTRTVVGQDELVAEGKLVLRGQRGPDRLDQTGNEWSARALPEDELRQSVLQRAELQGRVDLLSQERDGLVAQLAEINARLAQAEQQRSLEVANVAQLAKQLEELQAKLVEHGAERIRWRRAVSERERLLADATSAMLELQETTATAEMEMRAARRAREAVRQKLEKTEGSLGKAQGELKKMKATVSWRITKPLRKVSKAAKELGPEGGVALATRRVRKVLRQGGVAGATKRAFQLLTGKAPLGTAATKAAHTAPASTPAQAKRPTNTYADWVRQFDTLRPEGRAAMTARAKAFGKQPLVSVVMITHQPNLRALSEAIDSVRAQIYPHWELCIVDLGASDAAARVFLERVAEQDPRVRVSYAIESLEMWSALNAAVAMAGGEWIAFLEQDGQLREHSLFWLVEAINRNAEAKLIYSDEDSVNERGERVDPNFKCDWNYELLLSHDLFAHLSAYDASMLRSVGGLREGFQGAETYDLALRCVEQLRAEQIHHVPRVLYTRRSTRLATNTGAISVPPAWLSGQHAVNEHFQRTGVRARSELVEGGIHRTRYQLPEVAPLVSLVIPTRNALKLVRQCMESVFNRTTYPAYEILLVDNGSDDPAALAYFAELAKRPTVRVLRDDRPFNYSALNNMAVELAKGEFVCLLNNDIEVISPYWLNELVGIALQPQIGAVGARLWYPNDTLQHGGVIVGVGGVAGHAHKCLPRGNRGYFGRADMMQSLSAVTAACLLVKRSLYREIGGLNETELKVAFNDVDFCLRVREAGYRNVWTPYANLYHHESASRGIEDTPEKQARFGREVRYMKLRWADELENDPAYNPNLSFESEDFSLAWPPRR